MCDDIRYQVALAKITLTELQAIVEKFPPSKFKDGQQRYLHACSRSLDRMHEVVGASLQSYDGMDSSFGGC